MKYLLSVVLFSVLVPIAAFAADLNKDLMKAAAGGDAAMMSALLEKGANPNARTATTACKDCTPLFLAARSGHAEAVKLLLDKGADVNAKIAIMEKSSSMAGLQKTIYEAVLQENLNAMSTGRQADFDGAIDRAGAKYKKGSVKTIGGWTALMAAAGNESVETVRLLLEKGADVQAKDGRGNNALLIAAANGRTETAALLIEKGLDVRARNQSGASPLLAAAEKGHLETVKLLLDRGADVDEKDQKGNNALLLACQYGRTAVVGTLIEKGADVKAVNKSKQTAIGYALGKHDIAAVKLLLNAGAQMNTRDENAGDMLSAAASQGDTDTITFLLEKGVPLNIEDSRGQTALMQAAAKGQINAMKVLIEKGADLNFKASYGATAFSNALENNHVAAAKLLMTSGAKRDGKYYSAFVWAIMAGEVDSVKAMIAKGANVNAKGQDTIELPVIGYAAMMGETEIVRLLIEKGAKVDAKGDYRESTALMEAARNGRVETVRLLLEKGASVKGGNRKALILAAERGWDDIIGLFIKKGMDISNQVDLWGTALGAAVMNKRVSTVKLLLEGGAKVDEWTLRGDAQVSPLIIAAQNDDVEVAKLLIAKGADINRKSGDKTVLGLAREAGAQKMIELLTAAGAKEK